jgi:hypothetical protein
MSIIKIIPLNQQCPKLMFSFTKYHNADAAIIKRYDKTILRPALHDRYEQKQKNYDAWAKVYSIYLNEVEYHKTDKQKAWCQTAEVAATPILLLNGYRLPGLYQLLD